MKVLFHSNFIKKYSKLSKKVRGVCDERMHLFESEPYDTLLNTHQLHGVLKGYFSISIKGDLRAVFRFLEKDIVQFVDLDNHNNLYK